MSDKAGFSSSEAAAMGGNARAKALSREERSAIARAAVEARWKRAGKPVAELPQAINEGELKIDKQGIGIPCAVLNGGTRLLTQQGVLLAIGRARTARGGQGASVDKMIPFLAANNLKPFITNELLASTTPVKFRTLTGVQAFGFRAELLPEVCDVFLKARQAGALMQSQKHIAIQCEILIRGFAKVGIIALVDEATGYQDTRPRDALAKILEAFVAKEIRKWVKTFPPEFYEHLFRLKRLPYPPQNNIGKPSFVGHLTNDIVYARLAPGVLEELRRKNPRTESGNRAVKHHQFLTENIGHPRLREHLASVTTLMKVSDTWDGFYLMLEKAHRKYQPMPLWDASGLDPEA